MARGDPRVLLAMNVALSFLFSWLVFAAFAFVDVTPFSWSKVLVATGLLVVLTRVVTR